MTCGDFLYKLIVNGTSIEKMEKQCIELLKQYKNMNVMDVLEDIAAKFENEIEVFPND